MQTSGLTPFVVALVISFCFFVFFANSLNPFVTPRRGSSRHPRVKYIRYVAIALFLSLSLAVALYQFISQPLVIAAIAGAGLFAVMIFLPTVRYYDIELAFSSRSKESKPESQEVATTQEESPTFNQGITTQVDAARAVEDESEITNNRVAAQEKLAGINRPIAPNQTQALSPITASTENDAGSQQSISGEDYSLENETELQQRISTEEYAMEVEIAKTTALIDDDLTDFDQSIAEAEFEAVHTAQTDNSDIATPSFPAHELDTTQST